MRTRSQRDIRSMLSKAALKSTNAMYNVRLCSLHFSIICRRANIWSMVERPGGSTEEDECQKFSWYR